MPNTPFIRWMKSQGLTVKNVTDATGLDKKTISGLRTKDSKQLLRVQVGVYLKLFKAYPNTGLNNVFSFLSEF